MEAKQIKGLVKHRALEGGSGFSSAFPAVLHWVWCFQSAFSPPRIRRWALISAAATNRSEAEGSLQACQKETGSDKQLTLQELLLSSSWGFAEEV